jgi:putative flippase GtrA
MPTEERLAVPPPPVVSPPAAPPVHLRVRHGIRRPHNWVQLFKFCLVGGSGYVVNLAVFMASVWVLGVHHLIAATLAFMVAVANNFWWNRHWTFGAGEGRARFQAPRFFAVSVAAFLFQAALLDLLVVVAGLGELLSQAVSVAAATPLNFAGNKMWSFAAAARSRA